MPLAAAPRCGRTTRRWWRPSSSSSIPSTRPAPGAPGCATARRDGWTGAQVDGALSLRAAPVAAGAFWPDSLARQRAAAIDLAGAVTTGGVPRPAAVGVAPRPRALRLPAAGVAADPRPDGHRLLVRRRSVALPRSGRRSPPSRGGGRCVPRSGSNPMPRATCSARCTTHPGRSRPSARCCGRRIRPRHAAAPTRPLVWAALVLTVVAAVGLLRHEPGESASRAAVGLSIVMLGVLWAFTVRSLVERNWSRTSYRVRLRRPAQVDGVDCRDRRRLTRWRRGARTLPGDDPPGRRRGAARGVPRR